MEKKSKIQPTQINYKSALIFPTKLEDPNCLSFNFKRLREKEDKFKFADKGQQYFLKLFERLKIICEKSLQESLRMRTLRFHPIDFVNHNVTEKTFGLNLQVDDKAYQLSISSNEHGRIHGYIIDNIFYIVWLDTEHELYPGK